MHFVNQVDLITPARRHILHVIEHFTGVFNLGFTRRIDFNQINKTTLINLTAYRAFTARCGADPLLAIETLGHNPCNGGFTHTTRTRK